jgi:hypothetical protein
MTIDTADLVRLKATGLIWQVACVHDSRVYLCMPGSEPVRRDDVELLSEATPAQRQALIAVLAASSMEGHRPRCARERLQATAGTDG